MHDVIVVGARCAGSSTAMLLAREGYDVLLVDRATFPSDVMSTHWIQQTGLARLQRWGILEEVEATGCPCLPTLTFDFGEFRVTGSAPPAEGVGHAIAPRRHALDHILWETASKAGVEVREGCNVDGLIEEDGKVCGIRARSSTGEESYRAHLVVGADGMNSRIAEWVGASRYKEVPTLLAFYYSYWSGVEHPDLTMYVRPGRGIGVIPTNDNLVCIGVAWPASEFKDYRRDIEGNLLRTLELTPEVADKVREGRREEKFVGTGHQPNFFRKPYGPGWALVGDAGYHKDAVTAQGISDAFRDAELLSEAVHGALSGRRPFEDAMADYQRARDETAMPMYELTCQMGNIAEPPPPEMIALMQKLSENQDQADRYAGLFAGTVPIPEFMSTENLDAIMN